MLCGLEEAVAVADDIGMFISVVAADLHVKRCMMTKIAVVSQFLCSIAKKQLRCTIFSKTKNAKSSIFVG